MWHEARKQERLLRSMMVDYRRRAERRREYYEKTKGDPAQFLQIHGRAAKIHIDPSITAAADSPATMMPWQGQPDILIDRFDVRAHLDYIPPRPKKEDSDSSVGSGDELWEDRQANYERYRILVQNEFIAVSEEKFLHQIHIEEQFGPVQRQGEEDKKKMLAPKKAAIGFNYEDSVGSSSTSILPSVIPPEATEDDESDSNIDLDLSIAVDKITTEQMHELNKSAMHYGLGRQDFMSLLSRDVDEQESMRVAKEEEQERAMYSGRKARKERRAFRERKLQALLQNRCLSPPSYAARASPTYGQYRRSTSPSKSRSPSPCEGGITFITSFGGEESDQEAKGNIPTTSSHKRRDFSSTKKIGIGRDARDLATRPRDSRSRSRETRKRSKSCERNSRHDRRPSREASFRRKIRHHSRRSKSRSNSRRRSRSRSTSWRRSRSSSRHRSRSRSRSVSRRRSRSREYRRSRRSSRSKSNSRRSQRSRSHSSRWRTRERTLSRDRKRKRTRTPSSDSESSSTSTRSSSSDSPASSPLPTPRESSSVKKSSPPVQPPAPPIRRYYGRQKNSESPTSDEEVAEKPTSSTPSNKPSTSSVSSAGATKNGMTPRERLKRKMQAALNKQYKADKRAEKEKLQKVEQERMNREQEMRELALRLRRKERQRRHAMQGDSGSSSGSSRSSSRSRSRSPL